MAKKKIILFLVEGITDQTSLGLVLSRLINDDKVEFQITSGDVCYKDGINFSNVINTINNQVADFLKMKKFNKKDIFKIIHLLDTDGAFVSDSILHENSEIPKTCYHEECIETPNLSKLQSRNSNKKSIIQKLIKTSDINKVPYSIFYFSRNLEHVLHNITEEICCEDKMNLAIKFEDQYAQNPQSFVEFIKDIEIAAPGNYCETWEYIKFGNNSLQRKSNFHLLF